MIRWGQCWRRENCDLNGDARWQALERRQMKTKPNQSIGCCPMRIRDTFGIGSGATKNEIWIFVEAESRWRTRGMKKEKVIAILFHPILPSFEFQIFRQKCKSKSKTNKQINTLSQRIDYRVIRRVHKYNSQQWRTTVSISSVQYQRTLQPLVCPTASIKCIRTHLSMYLRRADECRTHDTLVWFSLFRW